MFDICASCGSTDRDTFSYWKITSTGVCYVFCTNCHKGKSPVVHDVWYGYGSGTHTEENIADPTTGQPIPFSSRQGKWEAMQKAGVREAGDFRKETRPSPKKTFI